MPNAITPERVFFQPTKEDRGNYFVEYRPPVEKMPFATLSICCIEPMQPEEVARAMETELAEWLRQYPVPIMVSASDPSDRVISLESVRSCDHLIGWLEPDGKTVTSHWRILKNEELPNGPFAINRLLEVYRDIPYKTPADTRLEVEKQARAIRFGVAIIIVWLVVIPATIAIVGWANPWVGAATTVYSLWQAYQQWLKLTGRKKKSAREEEKEAEQALVRHHHYHCEMNPEGFRRLKLENFERLQREAFAKEVAELRENAAAEKGDPK